MLADADPESGAFRCLLDMGMEMGNWGYRPILALQGEPVGASLPAGAGTFLPSHALSLPRFRRGRSAAQYASDLLRTAQSAYRLARIIRREGVALVHVNEILDVYAGIAARLARVPCVWRVRADVSRWPSPLRKVLPRIVAALASEIVAVSDSVHREVFLEQGNRDTEGVGSMTPVPTRRCSMSVSTVPRSVRSSACQTTGSSLCWYRSGGAQGPRGADPSESAGTRHVPPDTLRHRGP